MKLRHVLRENVNPRLLQAVSNDQFNVVNDYAVFIWVPYRLQYLFKHGFNGQERLSNYPHKSEVGIGVVNLSTGDIVIGDIERTADGNFEAKWASSIDDPADFFQAASRNAKIRNWPGRLQYLANKFEEKFSDEEEKDLSGVDAIVDKITNDDSDYDYIPPEAYDFKTNDPVEARQHMEEVLEKLRAKAKRNEAKHKIFQKKLKEIKAILRGPRADELSEQEVAELIRLEHKLISEDTTDAIFDAIEDIENFLENESDLFEPSDEDKDDSEEDAKRDVEEIESEIDDWAEEVRADFPNLKFDVYDFYPQE